MEPRTNGRSYRRDSKAMSRLEVDLSSSPHQEGNLESNGHSTTMLRQVAGRIPHVCVVGAGVAGLRCADVLLQHGVKVTILEGRDRVGGRLCQGKVAGFPVDLGPNWIHGTDSNPILDLATETGTQTMNWDGRQAIYDEAGKRLEEKEAVDMTAILWTIIEQAMEYSNDHFTSIPADKSLFDFFEEKAKKAFPVLMDDDEEAKSRQQLLLHMAEMWGAFVGSPIQRQSLRFFWLEECIDGENLFVSDTYRKVLERIAEPALKGADIRFGHKVSRIISSNENEESPVVVEIHGQESQTFDEVIMTAPLGWLKRNQGAFSPKLPTRLSQAINALGYGHLDKVYITFPSAFWNESSSSEANNCSISGPNDIGPNVTATTAPVHQPETTSMNPNHFPGFTHWAHPQYTSSTNPSHWTQEAVNMAALPGSTAHPTLLFYIFGPTSQHIASIVSKCPDQDAKDKALIEFFEPYYSRLPNYDATSSACKPNELLPTLWANDELAGYGSYSNFQVGLEHADEDIEVMRHGMPERKVWLSGEHTAPFVALGTVTGAWWSGEGVGKRILAAYGLGKKEVEGNDSLGG